MTPLRRLGSLASLIPRSVISVAGAMAVLLGAGAFLTATPAAAATTSPWWHLSVDSRPTLLNPGSNGQIVLVAANLGAAAAGGEAGAVKIEDVLPAGLKLLSLKGIAGSNAKRGNLTCVKTPIPSCNFEGALPAYEAIEMQVNVHVEPSAVAGEETRVAISGGGAPSASLSRPLEIGEEATPFGASDYELSPEEPGGAPALQAGSHPFQLTTTFTLNQTGEAKPAALLKDATFSWPAGLLGNPSPLPTCDLSQFLAVSGGNEFNQCTPQTAVGVAMITIYEPQLSVVPSGLFTFSVPVFNLDPGFGEPARFGFLLPATPVLIDPSLRSGPGGDYGITVSSLNTSQTAAFTSATVTVWGTPGNPLHDPYRGNTCLEVAGGEHLPCVHLAQERPPAFLTLPTACSGSPLASSVLLDSWAEPHDPLTLAASPPLPTMQGCNRLPFAPAMHGEPTSNAATSSTGFKFDLSFEDEGISNPEGLVQSQLKKAVVTLPQGFTANPSVAEGLKACSQAEYEAATVQAGSGCNPESKVGSVEIESPLVEGKKVLGGLFVARQKENPNGNLLTLYLIARNEELGVLIRQALKVAPDPVTGQLTTEVDNVPQLPFSNFHLAFRSGQRSPLITPPACGPYTVKALLYPRSNPGTPVERSSSFQITQGPEGQPCPSGATPPFHPNLEAGTQNNAAGTYSPFYTRISRKDSEQEITHFSIKLPPGVVGKLAGIPFCSDPAIAAAKAREHEGGGEEELNSPSCPQASEIGRTNVGTGVGNVLAYAPGKLYLAGPYNGAPISIVSITAAKVGPFDLGTVVVREALKVNPETAEVFVDATGSDPIPHIVDGIPVHLRDIRVYVNRPEFVLNPTSCEKTSTASTVLGAGLNFASEADDVPVTVSSPFQAADCAALGFHPSLKLSLKGKTNRGATPAFTAKLTMPPGDANIASSVVTLPHSEFLDNAHIGTSCTRVQFNAGGGNGERCPAASIYGHAKATTPILSEPLEGPVFLRSNGGERKLPDLVAALHGQEINIDLVGFVESGRGGTIRNTFAAVPDAPAATFTLEMAGGSKGLLQNSTDLCASTNRAISEFTAHNGKVSNTNPVLKPLGCHQRHKKGKGHGKHKRHR